MRVRGGERPEVVCFGFSDKKWNVFFGQFISNHCVGRRHTTFADRQIARMHRAVSDMLRVTCKWRVLLSFHGVSGVPTDALLVVLQQWLLVASVGRTFPFG